MKLKKVLCIASVTAMALGAAACASTHASGTAQLADGSTPAKAAGSKTLHRYDPFTDPFEALSNPLVGSSPPPARAGRSVPH